MSAHITMHEVPFMLSLVGVGFVSGAVAFVLGRRSATATDDAGGPTGRHRTR